MHGIRLINCRRAKWAALRRKTRPALLSKPLIIGSERHAKPVIMDSQIAVGATRDRRRHDGPHFLRHDSNIARRAATICEAIEAEAAVEMAEKHDVLFKRDVGSPAAATAAAASTAATSRSSATATAAASRSSTATAAATTLSKARLSTLRL